MRDIGRLKVVGVVACSAMFLGTTATPCVESEKGVESETEVPIAQVEATADLWANILTRDGSLAAESNRMLDTALQRVRESAPPAACEQWCNGEVVAEVIYRSVPRKTLDTYTGQEDCEQKRQAPPFVVPQQQFADTEAVAEWIQDFSRGKGEAGRALYEKCAGGCSPRYTFFLTPQDNSIGLRASVMSGPKRDREDNRYELSSSYHWVCQG